MSGENIIEIAPEINALFNDYYAFRNLIDEAIQKNPEKIVLDLSKIPVMNSVSISALVWLLKDSKDKGIQCEVRDIHPDLIKTFKVLNIDQYFA